MTSPTEWGKDQERINEQYRIKLLNNPGLAKLEKIRMELETALNTYPYTKMQFKTLSDLLVKLDLSMNRPRAYNWIYKRKEV